MIFATAAIHPMSDAASLERITGVGAFWWGLLWIGVSLVVTALTAKVITEAPDSLRKLRPDLPEELRSVILKCLEKSVDHRFQSVAELVAALSPFASQAQASAAAAIVNSSGSLQALSTTSPPGDRASIRTGNSSTDVAWDKTQLAEGQRRRSKAPLVAAAVVLVGLAIGVGVVLKHQASSQTGTTGATATATTSTVPAATTSASPLSGLPTTRDPVTPLVSPTGGPDRPLPGATTAATTAVAPTVRGASTVRPTATKDAGAPITATTTPTSVTTTTAPTTTTTSHDILPTSRN